MHDVLQGYLKDCERTTQQKINDIKNDVLDYAPVETAMYEIAIRLETAEILYGDGFKRRVKT